MHSGRNYKAVALPPVENVQDLRSWLHRAGSMTGGEGAHVYRPRDPLHGNIGRS